MATLWIGDFRCKQIQYNIETELAKSTEEQSKETESATTADSTDTTADTDENKSTETAPLHSDGIFFIENAADTTWLKNNIVPQLPLMAMSNVDIVLMLGFIDCVRSCAWDQVYNIETIATDYLKTIDQLVTQYSSNNFYVCSICPVEADYPFAAHPSKMVPKQALNTKIELFNSKIKDSTATFLDVNNYTATTSFNTRDGIRYAKDTCKAVQEYVLSHFASSAIISGSFVPRLDPLTSNDENWLYWVPDECGGYNYCIEINGSGTVLPNCTGYAWGRFYEIQGGVPANGNLLSTGHACDWFGHSDDYNRGDTPAEGAVICWSGGSEGFGHVAIVEQVNSDTSITISESNYYAGPEATSESNPISYKDGTWYYGSSYTFLGFIYNPAVTPGLATTTNDTQDSGSSNAMARDTSNDTSNDTSSSTYISNDEYLSQSEMETNARYIWNYLGTKGWSLNAVAGMLGNMEKESTINPGLGEKGYSQSGFGLTQWTPKSKLTDWTSAKGYADGDIVGQLERIIYERDNEAQWSNTSSYPVSFSEFSTSTQDPYWLACAFAWNYERSGVVCYGFNSAYEYEEYAAVYGQAAADAKAAENREALRKARGGAAESWYNFLCPYAPSFASRPKFTATNFLIDEITSTTVKFSCLAGEGKQTFYELFDPASTKIAADSFTENTELVNINSFDVEGLTPNTNYKLTIKVIDEAMGEESAKDLSFTTLQAFPKSVTNLRITATNTALVNKTVRLTFTPPTNDGWGYWKKNAKGYRVVLIVNGKVLSNTEKIVENLSSGMEINLSNYFGYTTKLGDTIQIGVQTWTKDDEQIEIFDSQYVEASNSICLLNKSCKIYLKTGK